MRVCGEYEGSAPGSLTHVLCPQHGTFVRRRRCCFVGSRSEHCLLARVAFVTIVLWAKLRGPPANWLVSFLASVWGLTRNAQHAKPA